MIGEGSKVPSLKAATSAGETIDLGARGGPLVLYFYPKGRNGSYEEKDTCFCGT